MARKNLAGYPDSWGGTKASVFVHTGPASYVQVINGTPPTGGDTVQAVEAGLGSLDFVNTDMTSDDGQFGVQAISPNGNSPQAGSAAVPSTTCKLRWFTASTGAEVGAGVNLSARSVRIKAIGRK